MAKQYVVIDKEFSKDVDYGNDPYLTNWPGLYILENGKKAYVGQSNHLIQRMSQHSKDPKKAQFNKVHFIYANHFNQSVTFDYESKLNVLLLMTFLILLTRMAVLQIKITLVKRITIKSSQTYGENLLKRI